MNAVAWVRIPAAVFSFSLGISLGRAATDVKPVQTTRPKRLGEQRAVSMCIT